MVIPLIPFALASQAAPEKSTKYDAVFSKRLLKSRGQFEEILQTPRTYTGYYHIYSEMLGGAYAEGLYPIGSAKKRFIISHNGPAVIYFQSRHGKKAKIDWVLPLVEAHEKQALKGTVLNYLMRSGLKISPQAKLSKRILTELTDTTPLAGFTYHPMNGGNAWIIKSDGTCMPNHKSDTMFSILPEENDFLRQQKAKQ